MRKKVTCMLSLILYPLILMTENAQNDTESTDFGTEFAGI